MPTPTGADTRAVVTGLFYDGGINQLSLQVLGSFTTLIVTLAVSFVLMYAVRVTGSLRSSQPGEIEGLDIHEHGMPAYPKFVLMGRFSQARTPTQLIPQNAKTTIASVSVAGAD